MTKPGGWSVEDLRKSFRAQFGDALEPLGIQKKPYPYYGGVKPAEKKPGA
jgi:hypothetical protein